ncbi:Ig-like domain-containing protein [Actinoplanes sp. NPDC049118]|uniref:Ig-like domain-containing protein n=1 Tax=Actinoplanes sp. NPDC049118 TaxID=3155769 RepID=UPI0033F08019
MAISIYPVANPVVAAALTGQPVTIDVTANDFGDAIRPIVITPPANGTVTGSTATQVRAILGATGDLGPQQPLIYTPGPHFVGLDTFRYMSCATEARRLCDEVAVLVHVGPDEPTTPTPPEQPEPSMPGAAGPDGLPVTGPRVAAPLIAGALLLLIGSATCLIDTAIRRRNLHRTRTTGSS